MVCSTAQVIKGEIWKSTQKQLWRLWRSGSEVMFEILMGLIVIVLAGAFIAAFGFGILGLLPLFFTGKITEAENKFWKGLLGCNPNAKRRRRR